MSSSSRAAAVLAGVMLALGGCGSGRTVSAPAIAATTATTPSTAPATTATTAKVDAANLPALLLTAADLPPGYTTAAATEPGDLTDPISPCGHAVTEGTAAPTEARAAFDRAGNQERVSERLTPFNADHGSDPTAQLAAVHDSCRQFDATSGGKTITLLVSPIAPPAVGDQVVGVQLAYSARFFDLIVIRSGHVDATVILAHVGNVVDTAGMEAVVRAAATKLAAAHG
jgi:hypothetical protein